MTRTTEHAAACPTGEARHRPATIGTRSKGQMHRTTPHAAADPARNRRIHAAQKGGIAVRTSPDAQPMAPPRVAARDDEQPGRLRTGGGRG